MLADDIRRGLEAPPRSVPSKYCYDHAGSLLFERITEFPESYLTRVEGHHPGRRPGCDWVELTAGQTLEASLSPGAPTGASPSHLSACFLTASPRHRQMPRRPGRSRGPHSPSPPRAGPPSSGGIRGGGRTWPDAGRPRGGRVNRSYAPGTGRGHRDTRCGMSRSPPRRSRHRPSCCRACSNWDWASSPSSSCSCSPVRELARARRRGAGGCGPVGRPGARPLSPVVGTPPLAGLSAANGIHVGEGRGGAGRGLVVVPAVACAPIKPSCRRSRGVGSRLPPGRRPAVPPRRRAGDDGYRARARAG
jgi:hypothetical protein